MKIPLLRRFSGTVDLPRVAPEAPVALAAVETPDFTPAPRSWPRQFISRHGSAITVFRPHIDTLKPGLVTGHVALSLVKNSETTARYGVASFAAHVSVDREANQVTLTAVKVDRVCFLRHPA